MTDAFLQTLWLHRKIFVSVMSLMFVALTVIVFGVSRPRATVLSSIEIGVVIIDGKQEPIEAPETISRLIPAVFGPRTIQEMAAKGASPSVLTDLRNPRVENIGRTIVLSSTVEPGAKDEATEFQVSVANQIIKREAPRSELLREELQGRIDSAARISNILEEETEKRTKELTRVTAFSVTVQEQIQHQRESLAALYQRSGADAQPSDRTTLEAQIRESREQISGQEAVMNQLTQQRTRLMSDVSTIRHQHEAQLKAIADARLAQKFFSDTRFASLPSVMPAPGNYRRLSMLFLALFMSLLTAVGAVVLLHNNFGRRFVD